MFKYLYLIPLYLVISALPLLISVGRNLEYEYALIVSWLSLVILPLSALFLPLKSLLASPPESMSRDIIWVFFISPLILLVPGVSLFLNKICLCSSHGFLFWMILLAYPAHILSHGLFYALVRGRHAGFKKRNLFGIFCISYVFTIGVGILQLWFNPQKRIDHPLLGFLHGPIYDFWIPVDTGIFLNRGSVFFFAASLLLGAWLRKNALIILAICASLSTALTLKVLSAGYPSTSNSIEALHHSLSKTLDGNGFSLHYQPKMIEDSAREALPRDTQEEDKNYSQKIQTLFKDAQFHVDELSKILGSRSNKLPHVKIFVYPSEDSKKLLFGGGATDVTDVVTPSIHIVVEGFPHPTLRHELVHALASGFGYHGLGFHPNIAFTEGLAIALAPFPSDLSLDEGAASLLESGRISAIENLFSPLFWQEAGSRAYTTAGSLIKYLMETYGIESVIALYSGASLTKIVGKDENAVIKDWTQKIMATYDKKTTGLYTEALFRQGGVFQDLCPHTKKDYEKSKSDGIWVRVRQPLNFQSDRDFLPWLLSLDPSSLAVQNRIWRQEILRLGKERVPQLNRLETWAQTLRFARVFPPQTIEDIELGIQESDLLRFLGRREESLKILRQLEEISRQKNIGEGLTRFLLVRILVEELGEEEGLPWRMYFARFRNDIPHSDPKAEGPWIYLYLKLRSATPSITFSLETLAALATGQHPPPPDLPVSFGREFYTLVGTRLMDKNQFKLAQLAYQKASDYARSLHKEYLLEMVRRAQAFERF